MFSEESHLNVADATEAIERLIFPEGDGTFEMADYCVFFLILINVHDFVTMLAFLHKSA